MTLEDFASVKWRTPLRFRKVCESKELPYNDVDGSSGMFLIGDTQIALFRFPDNRLFASQNMCGHRRAFVLSEGMKDYNREGEAVIACPIHSRKFALEGPNAGKTHRKSFKHTIATFLCEEADGFIWVQLPDVDELSSVLGTHLYSRSSTPRNQWTSTPSKFQKDDPESKKITCAEQDSRLMW